MGISLALDPQSDNAYTWKSVGDLYTLQHDTAKAQAAYSKAKVGKQRQSVEDYLSSSQGSDIIQRHHKARHHKYHINL